MLESCDLCLTSQLLEYVYEEKNAEWWVINFLCEKLQEHAATLSEKTVCEPALQSLHALDILHDDVNANNIIVISENVKFIDLKNTVLESCKERMRFTLNKFRRQVMIASIMNHLLGASCVFRYCCLMRCWHLEFS